MKKSFTLILLSLFTSLLYSANYYIDYSSGNDNNSGTSAEQAWKHAPGDEQATGVPATVALQPGDNLYFKGGVTYRGNFTLEFSGDADNPISYIGNEWGNESAIIDGSAPITNWTALNDSIYYTDIPAGFNIGTTAAALNLHEYNSNTEKDDFMSVAQYPNPSDPFFYDNYLGFAPVSNHNITLNSITDSNIFNQTDTNYWNNSSILIWTNPNLVVLRKITRFSPTHRTVYFDDLNPNAIYPDGRDQAFAIYNSIHTLDQPGEYHVNFTEGRVYIYPQSSASIETNVSISMLKFGINLAASSNITIKGFNVRKFSGDDLRAGIGIGSYTNASDENANIIIKDCHISHNRHPTRGYGGIYVNNVTNCLIENNVVEDNYRQKGIFCGSGDKVIYTRNTVRRSGSTAISFYGCTNSQITYNSVLESKGGHSNGITVYIGSKDVLIAGNLVLDCASSITFQDGGNLYFFNNIIDSKNYDGAVNEWGRTSRGPWEFGEIVFINNTILSNPGKTALNIENSLDTINTAQENIYANTYLSYNNIIDAGGGANNTERDYNLYTSLAWNQRENYGWYLNTNELLEEVRTVVFEDAAHGYYQLKETSPAVAAGTNVMQFLPVEKFPGFNFNTDFQRNIRPDEQPWSLGALEYNHQGPANIENTASQVNNPGSICYPNPVTDVIKIKAPAHTYKEITNLNGGLLLSSTTSEIDISYYPPGVYIIKIFLADKKVITDKIIKL